MNKDNERKNYMKKIMLAGLLLAMSSIAMADSAQDVLKKARDDYYKQQEAAKAPKKAEKVKAEKTKTTKAVEVVQVEEEEVEEEVKPRTPMEKLEYNANKAAIKVDFYERVVRSVAREEKELDGYNEVLGKKKTAKVKQQKAEKPAKTKKKQEERNQRNHRIQELTRNEENMKAKKIMGIALLAFAIGQVSMAEKTDPNIERLLKIAKQKKAAEEKEARKQELLNSVTEEGETVPVTVIAPSKTAPKTNEKLEAKKNKEAEARKQKAEAKAMKAKYKNMSESEKMDVEIQRIKKRVNEINSNIETFHKTNEMLDKMEQRLEGIETKLK